MEVSEKSKMLISVFPSGRSVITILKDGKIWRTVSTYCEYEEILKTVSEIEELEVKERIWNEKMFQVSDAALVPVESGAAIGPRTARPSKKISLWPASWPRLF